MGPGERQQRITAMPAGQDMRAEAARAKPQPSMGYGTIAARTTILMIRGQYAEAISMLEGFLGENPDHIGARKKLMRVRLAAQGIAESANAAMRAHASGDERLMISVNCDAGRFGQALEIMESDPGRRLVDIDACGRIYRDFFDRRDLEGVFRVMSLVFRKCAPPKDNLRELICSMRKEECARRILDIARVSAPLCDAPDRPLIYSTLISVFKDLRMIDAAQEAFGLARESGSMNQFVCNSMLAAYSLAGRISEAEELFETVKANDLMTPHACTSMIELYSKAGQIGKAEEIFENAWSQEIRDPHLATVMTTSYLFKNEYAKAMATYDRAWAADVSDPILHGSMIRLSLKAGRLEDARHAFSVAVDRNETDTRMCGEVIRAFHTGAELETAFERFGEACRRMEADPANVEIIIRDLLLSQKYDHAERVVALLPPALRNNWRVAPVVRRLSGQGR